MLNVLELSFNSLAPRGANRVLEPDVKRHRMFQLTRPAGGEPRPVVLSWILDRVSTHSPRGGRTRTRPPDMSYLNPFQLTRPAGGEPLQ